jgi:hypothetical protein
MCHFSSLQALLEGFGEAVEEGFGEAVEIHLWLDISVSMTVSLISPFSSILNDTLWDSVNEKLMPKDFMYGTELVITLVMKHNSGLVRCFPTRPRGKELQDRQESAILDIL